METLNELNEKGRAKLSLIRDELENLDSYATDMGNQKYFLEVASQRHLLAGYTIYIIIFLTLMYVFIFRCINIAS